MYLFTFLQTLHVMSKHLGLVTFPSVTKSFFKIVMQQMLSFIKVKSLLFIKDSIVIDVELLYLLNITFNHLFKTFNDECRNLHKVYHQMIVVRQ